MKNDKTTLDMTRQANKHKQTKTKEKNKTPKERSWKKLEEEDEQ